MFAYLQARVGRTKTMWKWSYSNDIATHECGETTGYRISIDLYSLEDLYNIKELARIRDQATRCD